jgi:choline dehydrogenase-like flavoprotein
MVPAAVGMNSTEYKGRPACIYDGWCHVGCPIGALANPLVTYLGDARRSGAEVRPWSTVTRVLTNPEGTRITGVEYYDQKKQRQVQPASVAVLAAWAAQNPRILLNSATDKHPKGLANSSGLVGKYMMTHFISGTLAIFDEDLENHMGTTGAQYMSYDRYGKTSHKEGFGSSFIVAGSALKTNDLGGIANAPLDLFGADLHEFMKRAKRGLTRIGTFGEELPNIENRIELVSDKDEFGMPLAKIIHSYDKDAEAVWDANFDEGLRIAKATGAKDVWSARGNMPTIHLMGGAIMGTEAGNSVVNSYGQSHEIPNLYVAGPGIFATSGASNPTYTIFAPASVRGRNGDSLMKLPKCEALHTRFSKFVVTFARLKGRCARRIGTHARIINTVSRCVGRRPEQNCPSAEPARRQIVAGGGPAKCTPPRACTASFRHGRRADLPHYPVCAGA